MSNTQQTKKRSRQNIKIRAHNNSLRSKMRTNIKAVLKAIIAKDKQQAQSCYRIAVSILDKMVTKHIIHKNKAARHKSRLNQKIKNIS